MRAVVLVYGGLGNQLFQLSKALNLSTQFSPVQLCPQTQDHETPRPFYLNDFTDVIDPNFLIQDLNTKEKLRLFLCRQLRKYSIIKTSKLTAFLGVYFETSDLNFKNTNLIFNSVIFEGYWQNTESVNNFQNEIRSKLLGICDLKVRNNSLSRIQKAENLIHIRGGDFVKSEENMKKFGSLSEHYYAKALQELIGLNPKISFHVLTDDTSHARKLLGDFKTDSFIGPEVADLWESLCLMADAKRLVISNSTFAWWGGWLCSKNGGTVVMPAAWHRDGLFKGDLSMPRVVKLPPTWLE